MGFKSFLNAVKQGKEGRNLGVSTGLSKLDTIIYGIQKKSLITIGADSGAGKTSFAITTYVYNLIKNREHNKISILYYSFEMSKDALYAKLTSLYLWDKFKEIVPYKEILSMKDIISDERYNLILQSTDWLETLDSYLVIYDKALSPTAIYATAKEWLSTLGSFIKIDDHREDYIPKDDRFKVVIWDHVGSNWACFKVI